MNLDKKGTFKLLGIIFASIIFFAALTNLGDVIPVIQKIFRVFAPIVVGIAIAFVLNIPLRLLECRVFRSLTYSSKAKVWKKIKRTVCLAISVVLVLAFTSILISIILPQLIEALINFFSELPGYMDAINAWIVGVIDKFHIPVEISGQIIDWEMVSAKALAYFSENQEDIADVTMDALEKVAVGLFNLIFGFIFAIYILASKEKLARSGRRIVFSIFKPERARSLLKFATLSNKAFNGFVTGQTLEALTIGVLCFIGVLILGTPYPLLVSVIIAVTAFIPVFGPIIGTVICAFIILIVNPMKAIWFVVFIIILQQIESNVIYPKIMGKSVGLPGLWVLVAVTVFGGLWGIVGIIISIPICSVLYTLFDSWMSKRLIERNILHHHYETDDSKAPEESGFFKFIKRKKKTESENVEAEEKTETEEKEEKEEKIETK